MASPSGNSEEIRKKVALKLVEAIEVAEALAMRAERDVKKGTGGVSPKARWYHLMAYLSQTLNGVLQNMDMNQVRKQLAELEKKVVSLREQDQAPG